MPEIACAERIPGKSMQKLKYTIINRILNEQLSGVEIDILLYIARYQDETGKVSGVYYQDIVSATFNHKTQIYRAIKNLENKKFILREKNNRYDMDITILDNDFTGKNFRGNGYMRVNKKIFLNGDFFRMKAKEKILTLQLIKNCNSAANDTYTVRRTKFLEMYRDIFGVQIRSLGNYIKTLKKYFNFYLKNGIYHIKCLKTKVEWNEREELPPSDREMVYTQEVNKALRRNRMNGNTDEKRELRTILNQYSDKQNPLIVDLTEIIKKAITMSNEIENKLNIKLIHKLVRETVNS